MKLQSVLTGVVAAAVTPAMGVSAQDGNAWDAAYAKAKAALANLSMEEKVGLVTGVGWGKGNCTGNNYGAAAKGIPPLCMQDGPLGVKGSGPSTAFAPGIQAASTWDVALIRQRGQFLGEETKALGVNVLLGPTAGSLGKIPQGGRNWEGFGVDPYLAGISMRETVEGIQSTGAQACAKHWLLNEQEWDRTWVSAEPAERTIHELYAWPFMDAIKANVSSVMCSYNRVYGTYACANDYLMNKLLKDQLGFKHGYVVTDWAALTSTVQGAESGLDMIMPGSDYWGGMIYWGPQLATAIEKDKVSMDRLDDMVQRILTPWYALGQDEGYPSLGLDRAVQANHSTNVRAVARDGIVLLKNDDSALPLKKPSRIAVIGTGAFKGQHATNDPLCPMHACANGAIGMGWGSGSHDYPYFIAPFDAISERAEAEGITISQSNSDGTSEGAAAAQGAHVAIVHINAISGEQFQTVEGNTSDRKDLDPWHDGNALVEAVAAVSDNVVVVAHSTGPLILESVLSNPSVKAVVWAGLPSSESGSALVDILWGDVSPSGKLVYTIAKQTADYGTKASISGTDEFTEGLFIDYRHFDKAGIEPRYEFGYGLSYSKFGYSDLVVTAKADQSSGPTKGPIVAGGASDLWDIVATVTANVTNTGDVQAAEVAQLYVTLPSSAPETPVRQLRGFAKLPLAPGQSGIATFDLNRRDLSYWDPASSQWVLPAGTFGISVGASSRNLPLTDELLIN